MSKYFVWQPEAHATARPYSTAAFTEPAPADPRCQWRGDDYAEALRVAHAINTNFGDALRQPAEEEK